MTDSDQIITELWRQIVACCDEKFVEYTANKLMNLDLKTSKKGS